MCKFVCYCTSPKRCRRANSTRVDFNFADVATSFDNKVVVKPYHVSVGNAATVNVYFDVPVVVVVIFVLALELFHAFREAFIMGNHVEFVVVEPFNWSDIFLVVEP